ncbi:hypothetical protein PsorP6_004889 [Peronosclerospora sorghi]|uniref:Uncharacterized protein n=1 Tax=Peronosclerospora sorghi TaxID=230839 RepID=A0ACC0W5X7_9STRA|nr:hypothetical protein PsorP6_004889 [Peronosclerospora sorghi]
MSTLSSPVPSYRAPAATDDDGLVFLPVALNLTLARLLVLFALTRAASFLTHGVARNLVNNAVLCLFFSLMLFQTLQWIDIVILKLSRRSRRIWVAFRVANGLFYVTVLDLSLFHEAQVAKAR